MVGSGDTTVSPERQLVYARAILSGVRREVRLARDGSLLDANSGELLIRSDDWNAQQRSSILGAVSSIDIDRLAEFDRELETKGRVTLDPKRMLYRPPVSELTDRQIQTWSAYVSGKLKGPDEPSTPEHVRVFCDGLGRRIKRLLSSVENVPGLESETVATAWVELTHRPLREPRGPASSRSSEAHGRAFETSLLLEKIVHRAVVIGDPGAGKSTLMRWTAGRIIEGEHPSFNIPLLVNMRSYSEHLAGGGDPSLLTFAVRSSADLDTEAISDVARRLVRYAGIGRYDTLTPSPSGTRPLLLLDGYDEIAASQLNRANESIGLAMDSFPTLMSSRPSPLPEQFGFDDTYSIELLTTETASGLIGHYLPPSLADDLRRHIDGHADLRSLARNPFALTAMCGLALLGGDGAELPTDLRSFYEGVLGAIERNHRSRLPDASVPLDEARPWLERLSIRLLADVPDAPRLTFSQPDFDSLSAPLSLLKETIAPSRLARRVGEGGRYEMLHATIHEYLAACALLSDESRDVGALFMRFANHPLWRNAWSLCSRVARESGDQGFVRQLRSGLASLLTHRDRFGVLDCFVAEQLKALDETGGGMGVLGKDLRVRLWTLASWQLEVPLTVLYQWDPAYVTERADSLGEREVDLRRWLDMTLTNAETNNESEESLADGDRGPSAHELMAEFLAAETDQERIERVTRMLASGTRASRDALLTVLAILGRDDPLHETIIGKLHMIPCGAAVALLLQIVGDPTRSEPIRASAMRACTQCDIEAVFDFCLDFLEQPETPEGLVRSCGTVLRERGSPYQLKRLLDLASGDDSDRSESAFIAIGGIVARYPRSAEVIEHRDRLFELAESFSGYPNLVLRHSAVTKMMPLFPGLAEGALVRMLSEASDDGTRGLAAEGLARLGRISENAANELQQRLSVALDRIPRLGARSAQQRLDAFIEKVVTALLNHSPQCVLQHLDDPRVARAAASWSHRTGDLFFSDRIVRASDPNRSALLPEPESTVASLRATGAYISSESLGELSTRITRHERLRARIFGEEAHPPPTRRAEAKAEAAVLEYIAHNRDLYEKYRAAYESNGTPASGARQFISGPTINRAVFGKPGGRNTINQYEAHKAARRSVGVSDPKPRSQQEPPREGELARPKDDLNRLLEQRRQSGQVDDWAYALADEWLHRIGVSSREDLDELLAGLVILKDTEDETPRKLWKAALAWWLEQSDPSIDDLRIMLERE